jgi:hypothetical protein
VAWVIPRLDLWTHMPTYLLQHWEFVVSHWLAEPAYEFADANLLLCEAIYTLVKTGQVAADWRTVEVAYQAVSSLGGRRVWDRVWTQQQCDTCLNPEP